MADPPTGARRAPEFLQAVGGVKSAADRLSSRDPAMPARRHPDDAPSLGRTRSVRARRAVALLLALPPAVAIAAQVNGTEATETPEVSYVPFLAYFLLAMLTSFVCSLLEATILSISPARVEVLASEGRPSGLILRRLKERVDRPLIAILTTNTIANMLGAAGVGAEAQHIAETLDLNPGLFVLASATALTCAILLFSEIVPKSLGAAHAKSLAVPAAYALRALVALLWPIVIALEGVPRLIARGAEPAGITREEIAALAELGHRSGTLKEREGTVIANLFALDSVLAKDVMTPRVEMFSLERTMTAQEVLDKHKRLRYSRIPIHDGGPDTVTGMVLRYRLFEVCVRGKGHRTLDELAEPIHAVPETAPLGRLLDTFIQRHAHLFLVVDEYAGTSGIVTLEDVVETLLGVEIVDESDLVDNLRRLARERMQEKMRLRAEREARESAGP